MKKYIIIAITMIAIQNTYAQNKSTSSEGKLRIAARAGFSYRLAALDKDIPDDFKSYVRSLKSGYGLGLEATYFIKPEWGFGAMYSYFGSSGSLDNVQVDAGGGIPVLGTITDDISIHYIAPTYVVKKGSQDGVHSFVGTLSAGYMAYKNVSSLVVQSIEITGSTIGFGMAFGYDYQVSDWFSIGAQASFVAGTLSKLTVRSAGQSETIDLNGDEKESLTRIDLSAGVRFYLQ